MRKYVDPSCICFLDNLAEKQTDKQTDKHTIVAVHPTHAQNIIIIMSTVWKKIRH